MSMNHGSLFSGIGGFDLASEWMGWNNKFHCEWNEFGQKILKHYWPNAKSYGDITKTDFTFWRGKIDILTGGFPCQPYSLAGKRKGKEDERHLWPEMLRAIREIQPSYVVGENVYGLVNWNGGLVFDEVQYDLETEGYEVLPVILPAVSVKAWHRRDRIWFVAHLNSNGCETNQESKKLHRKSQERMEERHDTNSISTPCFDSNNREERTERCIEKEIPEFEGIQRSEDGGVYARITGRSDLSTPVLCRSYDGIPSGVDRVAAYGNAIVPQVAFEIFKVIEKMENIK